MPHLVVRYTGNLDAPLDQGGSDVTALCRALAETMLLLRDEAGQPVMPPGGIRVFAYPAPHFAVADGGAAGRAVGQGGDYGFVYLTTCAWRMARGRGPAVLRATGLALEAVAKAHFCAAVGQPADRRDAADRRRYRGVRRQKQLAAPAVQPTGLTPSYRDPRPPPC